MKKNRRLPERAGLKPLSKQPHGYQVFVTADKGWFGEGWYPINSTWGFPYEIKGFAINRAKGFVEPRHGTLPSGQACVVNIKTGEIVWSSWDDLEQSAL